MVDDLSGKILQRLVGAIRNEREKRPECADDNTRNIEDGLAGRKLFEGGDEFRFAVFFGKLEGGFQRRVETVTARLLRHLRISGMVIMLRAGKRIASQPARRRFSQWMIFSRRKIDGVAHGKHSSVSWKTWMKSYLA